MRFGLVIRNSGPEAARAVRQIPALAEDVGFDSVWASDHIVVPESFAEKYDAMWLECVAALTHVAVATARVRLGISALILPYRPAWLVAAQIASLETLAPGRVTIACGAGWLREEFDSLGVDFEARVQLTRLGTAHLRADTQVELLAAGNGPASIRRAREQCDGWHPIAMTPADLAARAPVGGRVVLRARVSLTDRPQQRPLYGPAEKIRSDIEEYARAGVDEIVLDYPTRDLDETLQLIERFAKEVMS